MTAPTSTLTVPNMRRSLAGECRLLNGTTGRTLPGGLWRGEVDTLFPGVSFGVSWIDQLRQEVTSAGKQFFW
jgi:hypothetical protein